MRNWLFVLSSVAWSTPKDFIRTRLPVTSCLYTNKNAVPASVHTLKTGDLTLSKKKKLLPGGGVFQPSWAVQYVLPTLVPWLIMRPSSLQHPGPISHRIPATEDVGPRSRIQMNNTDLFTGRPFPVYSQMLLSIYLYRVHRVKKLPFCHF